MDSFGDDIEARVQSELRDGERLVWFAQPVPAHFARAARAIVLFGIPWTAFSIFWVLAAGGMMFFAGNGPPGGGFIGNLFACFPLFGIPFILIGFGMLTSPFWMRRRAKRTIYAITDRRTIIWEAGWLGGIEVRSYAADALTRMVRREYAHGAGDLIFEEIVKTYRDTEGHNSTHTTQRGFIGIADVKEVEEVIRKTLLPNR